jgi:hypothetical protein
MRRLVFSTLVAALAAGGCASAPAGMDVPVRSVAGLADADTLRSTELVPGVTHVHAHYRRGPWTLHVVEVDAAVCRPVLEARKPEGRLAARAPTTELAGGSIVAINADFFMLPGGTPVGAHVRNGVPWIGPTDRHVFVVAADGGWRGGVARLEGHAAVRGDTARLAQVNRPAAAFSAYRGTTHGLTLFTARADSVAADTTAAGPRIALSIIAGDERRGAGVVTGTEHAGTATAVPAGAAFILAHGDAAAWAARRTAGDTVRWDARVVMPARGGVGPAEAAEAVGAFPELLHDGQDVLDTQVVWPPFGVQRHPRTAVGWSADGRRLFLVVVDGRQAPYSDGMSLAELAWLFRRIGAAHAVNLDGGGSTAIVVHGELVNRPSDREGERSVGNALALARCDG